ncbi:uncharacterized protein LOC110027916 [Phalaenopsis equestris]|uniref:uncharacterized protein LOC110027916 n=1 Tax=Phalaenopsis equestris TaxID=78828 RepID=UPI0009E56732|nr:uncharacterized protein LOC110027916 [Phalaenopsis equestris]
MLISFKARISKQRPGLFLSARSSSNPIGCTDPPWLLPPHPYKNFQISFRLHTIPRRSKGKKLRRRRLSLSNSMIPRPYSMDAHTRAQDLASSILTASSPPAIATVITAVESILCKLSPDQSRSFFSIAFPALICRLFGFDESSINTMRSTSSSTAWIDQAHLNLDLAVRLFALLSPQGPLFSAISSADRLGLVKYVFPAERLPEWMRYALQSERHSSILSDLCPLFRGRVKEDPIQGAFQLQLNAFEYYIFWFAYYPVCRGSSKGSDDILAPKSRRKSRLESWTSSLPVLVYASRRSGHKTEVSLYLRLFYSYMCAFVPKCGLGSHQPYRSSLLHYSSSCDISLFEQAEFLVYALIHFWLVDNDFSPLALNVCRSFGISFRHRALIVETPPTAGLGEMVKLFVKYFSSCLVVGAEGSSKVLGSIGTSSTRSMVSLESTVCSWNSAVQRPLYRFLLRTFLFCPIGASMKNVTQVFYIWVSYMVPWRTNPEDFVEFEPPTVYKLESSKKEPIQGKIIGENASCHPLGLYTPLWEGYVASNYLFYSSLVVHFLGFAHKFLHADVETVVGMVLKVLNILTSSKELTNLLRNVHTAYQSKKSGIYSHFNVDKYIPSIRQQLEDWEDGLCETGTDGAFLHENWNQDLRLFKDGEDGAPKLLQLFVLRAEHEIHLLSGENVQSRQALESIKSQMKFLFDVALAPQPHLQNSIEDLPSPCHGRKDVFAPKHPGFGTGKWADVKYKGDWMHRPISDTEVAWLARLLIRFSDWLNESLGFDRVESNGESCRPTYVEPANGDWRFEGGPMELATMLVNLVASWLGMFGHSLVSFMRGHGMRINLRLFSSQKFFMFCIIYLIFYALKKVSAALSLGDGVKLARNHT